MRYTALGAALLGTLILAGANAIPAVPTNATGTPVRDLDPFQPVLLPGTAVIYDDDYSGLNAACNAATSIGMLATCTNNAATLCAALTAGTATLISINSQSNALSIACSGVYGKAATYANGPGHHLIFQSWDLDICSSFGFCSAGEVAAVLGATGAAPPLQTSFFFSPTPSVSTNGICPQHLLLNSFAPGGGYATGVPTQIFYARVAQGAGVAPTGISCFVGGGNQVIFEFEPGGSDHYVGILPGAYKGIDTNGVPGEDMTQLYANLLFWSQLL